MDRLTLIELKLDILIAAVLGSAPKTPERDALMEANLDRALRNIDGVKDAALRARAA